MKLIILAAVLPTLVLSACGSGNSGDTVLSGKGESCTKTAECDQGLKCIALVCISSATLDISADLDMDAVQADTVNDVTNDLLLAEVDSNAVMDGIDSCQPDCDGKECGGDGCGGKCGTCPEGEDCPPGGMCKPSGALSWVSLPSGEFIMGCSDESDSMCDMMEQPPHTVLVSSFDILATEITVAQFEAVMGFYPPCGTGTFPDNGSQPVDCVTWYEADEHCGKVGGRLCTEAEWEYAARGGTTTRFYCGADTACLSDIAWYQGNAGGQKHPVATKTPNQYGLFDMLGNVNEWVFDWYRQDYYEESPSDNPQGPPDSNVNGKVFRGGGCNDVAGACRVTFRFSLPQSSANPSLFHGFRCCRDQ
jgi:formylglycine-generating enzyme required for sulfatase activity